MMSGGNAGPQKAPLYTVLPGDLVVSSISAGKSVDDERENLDVIGYHGEEVLLQEHSLPNVGIEDRNDLNSTARITRSVITIQKIIKIHHL